MDVEKLYQSLKNIQEAKGYYFNKDKTRVLELLEALLLNKERYGYMACPCRLAAGDREKDRDIFCPCAYREPDVQDYGGGFFELYGFQDREEGKKTHEYFFAKKAAEKKVLNRVEKK
ncbi:MAG: ferredoxin:thioredoxin reductase, partial [Deltaproteobacteria bacterium]|nr:ferredoxin:thioredoxin reductase [Deltaproteobacteria bacterium]